MCLKRTKELNLLFMLIFMTVCYLAVMFWNQHGQTSRLAEPSDTSVVQTGARLVWTRILPSWGAKPTLAYSTGTGRKTLLVPNDAVLETMDEQKMKEFYWKYINTLQVLCRNQTRLGSFKDGGKEVCLDDEFIPKKPCLVYSFGSNYQFDFEEGVINAFGCEVHTFDPTVDLQKMKKTKLPRGITFHLKGLADRNHVTEKNWHMSTLDTILKELKHTNRTLDLLKIDIEGSEWSALSQMFKSGTLDRTKQLLIEVHFARYGTKNFNWGLVSTRDQLKVLRELYENGFRTFMREHNLYSLVKFKSKFNTKYTNVNEISLINMKYRK